jgi:hypothetical protein
MMGATARFGLGTGDLRLARHMPNGQTFIANPRTIWMIKESRAAIDGQSLGQPGPLPEQGRLGEFLIPQRGVFAIVSAYLESFDAARHLTTVSKQVYTKGRMQTKS